MAKILREDYYFKEPGEQNTDDVIEAVKKRLCSHFHGKAYVGRLTKSSVPRSSFILVAGGM